MEQSLSHRRPRWRFSILSAFEVLTIFAVSLALHRDPKLPLTAALLLLWSAASGSYLGYRWRSSDDFASCGRLTVGLAALITFLNALALGIVLANRAQRSGGSYDLTWQFYLPHIISLAIIAAFIGMSLAGLIGAAAAYWRESRTGGSKRR